MNRVEQVDPAGRVAVVQAGATLAALQEACAVEGLDPGIDHCSAHALLARLRADGKQVVGFTSFCGGLPAPEAAEGVPLGYKFSWSPRGVLRAAGEGARFRLGGKVSRSGLCVRDDPFRRSRLLSFLFSCVVV